MSEIKQGCLSEFPPEVFCHILSFLCEADKRVWMCVSQQFQAVGMLGRLRLIESCRQFADDDQVEQLKSLYLADGLQWAQEFEELRRSNIASWSYVPALQSLAVQARNAALHTWGRYLTGGGLACMVARRAIDESSHFCIRRDFLSLAFAMGWVATSFIFPYCISRGDRWSLGEINRWWQRHVTYQEAVVQTGGLWQSVVQQIAAINGSSEPRDANEWIAFQNGIVTLQHDINDEQTFQRLKLLAHMNGRSLTEQWQFLKRSEGHG